MEKEKGDRAMIAIYLAAGRSRRMGQPKLSLPFKGQPLGDVALTTILSSDLISYVIIVIHKEDSLQWISQKNYQKLIDREGEIIICSDAEKGLSHSLKTGFRRATEYSKTDNIIVCLADQPFISIELIEVLQKADMKEFVACRNQQEIKPPILFHPSVCAKIESLTGDSGAKKLLLKNQLQGIIIDFTENKWFQDIDTIEEYDLLVKEESFE